MKYDLAISGGGLAGLALSIQIARKGYSVVLFEKEQYPFHRVCGEYISLESWNFLEDLGLDLDSLGVAYIKKLEISAPNGQLLAQKLPLGGFGISRYLLDHELYKKASESGVQVFENTIVNDIRFTNDSFETITSRGTYQSSMAASCHGKRSKLDINWSRPFVTETKRSGINYFAVKYHVQGPFARDTIYVHNFAGGYCGLSRVENDKFCLCYMADARLLQSSGSDIKSFENNVVRKNRYLDWIFEKAKPLYEHPLTISQISFGKKSKFEHHVMMIGDAAGMITPLCGNGMSMAFHGSKIAATIIPEFLANKITRDEMELQYEHKWKKTFATRLATGRKLQGIFLRPRMVSSLVRVGKWFPALSRFLIRQTHGQPF